MAGKEQVRGVRESRAIRTRSMHPRRLGSSRTLYTTYMMPVSMHGFGFRVFR
jgi:hypothetical protein